MKLALIKKVRGCFIGWLISFMVLFSGGLNAASERDLFTYGIAAYRTGNFPEASRAFGELARQRPSSGALLNFGTVEWTRGHVGAAILAWEQCLWVNPFDDKARNNLRFARETAQLGSPELAWYEVASSWLPPNWWAWLAGFSLWLAVGALVLPNVLRWRRAAWHQAVAAFGIGLFLLCIPAHVGTITRSNIGFILTKETPVRLTPTAEAEALTQLTAGDPVRLKRMRGKYVFIEARYSSGWILKEQLGLIRGD